MNSKLKLLKTNHLVIALLAIAAALLIMPFQIFAQEEDIEAGSGVTRLIPIRVFLFNDNTEINTSTQIEVASLSYEFSRTHRLIIDYSSVGAISANDASDPALLFIGCFVDGEPCIGTQTDPSNTPAGWVNVLSCDFTTPPCTAWDSDVGHVWFSGDLSKGKKHTVTIKAAVGSPLIPFKGTGTLFNEARNLVVTLLLAR